MLDTTSETIMKEYDSIEVEFDMSFDDLTTSTGHSTFYNKTLQVNLAFIFLSFNRVSTYERNKKTPQYLRFLRNLGGLTNSWVRLTTHNIFGLGH